MTTHTHETGRAKRDESGSLRKGIELLGKWMRNAHSRFGARFNRKYNRKGKVAYERAKTTEIQDDGRLLRVMFYGDANPVRAGIVKHPSQYEFSSYRFYAYGEENEITPYLTPPDEYLALGDTPEERQRAYRSLCDDYLRKAGLLDDEPLRMEARAIGDEAWLKRRREAIRGLPRSRDGPVPSEPDGSNEN